MSEKVVVTGGAGFIGSHLVDHLLAHTAMHVVVFDNFSRGHRANLIRHRSERRLQIAEGEVRDFDALRSVMRGARVVYHLAAQSGPVERPDNLKVLHTNVVGTFHVLRAATEMGIEHLVFASAGDVYGEPIELPVEEAHPLLPLSLFGASKAAGEVYCRAFRQTFGLRCSVLRFANVYGPRDSSDVIPLWLRQAESGENLRVYGSKQILDFVWIDQAVEALARVIALDAPAPPINVASGTGTPVMDIARRILRLHGGQAQIQVLPPHAQAPVRFVASVDRMKQLLELQPPLDPLSHLPMLIPVRTGAHV